MRKNYISMRIIEYLSDNKMHTYQEIADKVETSLTTIRRHVEDLSADYHIVTYHGGKIKGVRLLNSKMVFLTDTEKSKVIEALEKLNDLNLKPLIDKFNFINLEEKDN